MGVVAALVCAIGVIASRDWWGPRVDAWSAMDALEDGDLDELGDLLIKNRGREDFSYFLASDASPRELGDGLAKIAEQATDDEDETHVDPQVYELALTHLAGALALATHGTGNRELSEDWSHEFALATTTPTELYGGPDGFFDWEGKKRARQDAANRANLLLLLSRGYWSTDFLQVITETYYDFDREGGDDAWPEADPGDERFAPAPNGVYLTDGVLALAAALTANSGASEWAFTEFRPGTVPVDGSDDEIGKFTHFLFFEHEFPEGVDDESVGVTVALTALSSAIIADEANSVAGQVEASDDDASHDPGPRHDSEVLQALADDAARGSGCSPNPLDYGRCVAAAAKAVWGWIKQWGHVVLKILTLAAYAPPPILAVGAGAMAANATWYAVEGDFDKAGLSLVAAVPVLKIMTFGKGATAAQRVKAASKAGGKAVKNALATAEVAGAATAWRPQQPWKDCDLVALGGLRLGYGGDWTAVQRRAADEKVHALWRAGQVGDLKKTRLPRPHGESARTRYRADGGAVPSGHVVDHTVDLQLGGIDDLSNMKPLDEAVDAGLAHQVAEYLRGLEYGDSIPSAAIC